MKHTILKLLAFTSLVAFVSGCEPTTAPKAQVKQTQSEKAKQVAETIRFTENAEIDNIKKRLELTSQPGLLGFVAVINMAGAPVMYTCVKGKITSGSKRLTRPWDVYYGDKGQFYGDFITDSPSDEGTWGSSSPYMYWWTCGDQYIQTSQNYIYSDKPFRLTQQPLIAVDSATLKAEKTGVPITPSNNK